MAVRNIAVTDTLETFRTEFNDLAANDFGDIALLSGSISATNLVGAMNETISIATSTAGFTIEDSTSTAQIIGGGDTLKVFGTSNEIDAVVSATDTLTLGLPNDVTIGNDLTITNDLNVNSGTANIASLNTASISSSDSTVVTVNDGFKVTGTSTLGTLQVAGSVISSTDSSSVNIADGLNVTGTIAGDISTTSITSSTGSINFGDDNLLTSGYVYLGSTSGGVIFEGTTADGFETNLVAANPTADRSITIPNETGTLITDNSTNVISRAMMLDDSVGQDELRSVVTLIIYNSSGTPLKTIYGAGA